MIEAALESSVENLKPLTSLRFVAAMMIVLLHAKQYFSEWTWRRGLDQVQDGVAFKHCVITGALSGDLHAKSSGLFFESNAPNTRCSPEPAPTSVRAMKYSLFIVSNP